MLSHSPPLPLVIDYRRLDMTAEDEEGAFLALKQRDRVRCVRLRIPIPILQKFIVTMDEEYPILEYLIIELPIEDNRPIMIFPETFQAPNLRLLTLKGFALPIESRLLTTAVGLVTLNLIMLYPSTYFHPSTLLQWLSLMPQLETLSIYFKFSVPSHDVERQLTHHPMIAPVTLPNLRHFLFRGVNAYLEPLVHRITTPRLEKLGIDFFNQLTFSIPRLLQFINSTENLRFESATFEFFGEYVSVAVYPRELGVYSLDILVYCRHLDWQVSSMVQMSNSLGQVFSVVEHLTLQHREHNQSSEEHNEVDRTEWRDLLRPFSNVKTLRIDKRLADDLPRCLELEDGELPLELLPELRELTLPQGGGGKTGDAFSSFIDARQNAGRPINLVRPGTNPDSNTTVIR